MKISRHTAIEAKALVVMAFRNGPVENIHSGRKSCPMCQENQEMSRISDPEMKEIMKFAVGRMATLLMLRESDTEQYEKLVVSALDHVARWDEPSLFRITCVREPEANERIPLPDCRRVQSRVSYAALCLSEIPGGPAGWPEPAFMRKRKHISGPPREILRGRFQTRCCNSFHGLSRHEIG